MKKRVWIKETNILDDFTIPTGDVQFIKIPHLHQVNLHNEEKYNGFIEIGNSMIGAAYFEQNRSWGNFYPRMDSNGNTEISVKIKDAFGNKYHKKATVKILELKDAIRYNQRFGFTEHLFDKEPGNLTPDTTKDNQGGVSQDSEQNNQ